MRRFFIPFHFLAVIALMFTWAGSIHAADMGYDDPNSKYDAAKARCEGMEGSARQQCLKQAEDIRNSEKRGGKSERKEYKQQYEADKKKCEAMTDPDNRDNCLQQLKIEYERD